MEEADGVEMSATSQGNGDAEAVGGRVGVSQSLDLVCL